MGEFAAIRNLKPGQVRQNYKLPEQQYNSDVLKTIATLLTLLIFQYFRKTYR